MIKTILQYRIPAANNNANVTLSLTNKLDRPVTSRFK